MDSQCGFQGNSDIYGLGVRVGVYLQWSTSIFVENLHEPAVESCRDANTTFQVAMLAGLVLITSGPEQKANALEAYITLLFCFASACIASLQAISAPRSGEPTSHSKPGTERAVRGVGELILSTAIFAYGVDLLYVGLGQLPRTTCPEIGFFFWPVDLFAWNRTALKAIFTISLVGSVVTLLLRVLSLFRRLLQLRSRWGRPDTPLSPRPTELVRIVKVSMTKLVSSVVALVVFIIAIELTLAWNNIYGIYGCASFSQLFPLIVGAANLVRVIYQLLRSSVVGEARLGWSS
ncbi:hypothetical protein F4677DRAFT_390394 [Hypoxylon crocopeplum]|nr:hypothetical protein F4677DRAFT_390394 [Hypoxylon crocopeplum]